MISAGVIGWPIGHSKSPVIHRFWLEALGIQGEYSRFAVEPERLGEAVRALPALGLRGVNVTVPHKVAVMDFLDAVEPGAARIGAVNSVVCEEDGRLVGFNTDAPGFWAPLAGREFSRAVVIGAGGAARAVVSALRDAGVGQVTVVNRSLAAAEALASDALAYVPGMALPPADLVVNASSLGMVGQASLEVGLMDLPAGAVVYDLVYAPLETGLLREARARGLVTVDGLEMLVGQAAVAFARFFGAEAPRGRDAELRALLVGGLG